MGRAKTKPAKNSPAAEKTVNKKVDPDAKFSPPKVPLWLLFIPLGLGLIALVVYSLQFSPTQFASVIGVGLMTSVASLFVGAVPGFLFGLPRTTKPPVEGQEHETGTAGTQSASKVELGYRANTNLEDVSDWLTKILVGVGLTQISKTSAWLYELGQALKPGLGNVDGSTSLGVALVLYYTAFGFLVGFILTKRHLPSLFERGEQEARLFARWAEKQHQENATAELESSEAVQRFASDFEEKSLSEPLESDEKAQEIFAKCEREYVELRDQPPGPTRTFEMERLVARAMRAASALTEPSREAESYFGRGTSGSRIVALAIAQARPSRDLFGIAILAISKSRSAFEQVQGLRTLGKMMDQLSDTQKREACRTIADQRSGGEKSWILPGTERWALSDRLRSPDNLNCPP